jgi:hypothetical protein
MKDFFVQPWKIFGNGDWLEIKDDSNNVVEIKSTIQLRQEACERITDELVFIARSSEGSISLNWLMNQPIYMRKYYVDMFVKANEEREKSFNKMDMNKKQ